SETLMLAWGVRRSGRNWTSTKDPESRWDGWWDDLDRKMSAGFVASAERNNLLEEYHNHLTAALCVVPPVCGSSGWEFHLSLEASQAKKRDKRRGSGIGAITSVQCY